MRQPISSFFTNFVRHPIISFFTTFGLYHEPRSRSNDATIEAIEASGVIGAIEATQSPPKPSPMPLSRLGASYLRVSPPARSSMPLLGSFYLQIQPLSNGYHRSHLLRPPQRTIRSPRSHPPSKPSKPAIEATIEATISATVDPWHRLPFWHFSLRSARSPFAVVSSLLSKPSKPSKPPS